MVALNLVMWNIFRGVGTCIAILSFCCITELFGIWGSFRAVSQVPRTFRRHIKNLRAGRASSCSAERYSLQFCLLKSDWRLPVFLCLSLFIQLQVNEWKLINQKNTYRMMIGNSYYRCINDSFLWREGFSKNRVSAILPDWTCTKVRISLAIRHS